MNLHIRVAWRVYLRFFLRSHGDLKYMLAAFAEVVCVCSWHIKIRFDCARIQNSDSLFDEAEEEIGNVWFVLPLKGLITLDWFHSFYI